MTIEELKRQKYDYEREHWRDKVVDPEGDITDPGVKFTARRANNMEEGIDLAHDRLNSIVDFNDESDRHIKNLRLEFLLLKASVTSGITGNIFVENFENLNDIDLMHGAYDEENQYIYLP